MRALWRYGTTCCGIIFVGTVMLLGCTTVPDLEPTVSSIPIYKIVERVKCEVLDAVKGPLDAAAFAAAHHNKSRYAFLEKWTATVDLTLIVNQQSGISPGVSFVEPLTSTTIPLRLTNFARSFTFGVGGGVNGQALRTETLSFTLAFKELRKELDNPNEPGNLRYYHDCVLPHGTDLNSNLDLKTWIDSALDPLAPPTAPNYPYLTEGHHKPPARGGGGGGPKGPQAEPRSKEYVPTLKDILKASADTATYAKLAQDIAATATAKQASCVAAVIALSEKAAQESINAANAAYMAGLAVANGPQTDLRPYYEAAMTAFANAQDANDMAQKAYAKCAAPAPAPLDPPIDSITHQVQFIVTWSANASPSWTLAHFKGPGAGASSMLSGSQITTHTLLITLGAPAPGTAKGPSGEVQLQRSNAAINNLGQQIRPPATSIQ